MKYITLIRTGLALSIMAFCIGVLATTSEDSRKYVVSVSVETGMTISTSQLKAFANADNSMPEIVHQVSLLEEFRSSNGWFLSMQAKDRQQLDAYLSALGVEAETVIESLFVNSPALAGGPTAGTEPLPGHKVYVIQRDLPGIGLAPLEKKKLVSAGSQKIVESLGGAVEWDHSFLTTEGTYCVYRATDPAVIEKHAEIAGIPADPITEVEHIVRNFSF